MKYLLFQNPNHDYGASFDQVLVGARKRGFGAYEDKDAELLIELAPSNLISEISEGQYENLKKKLNRPPLTYRNLGMVEQDPSKDPNAVYVEREVTEAPSKKKPAKALVSVGKAKVEDPLEGKE